MFQDASVLVGPEEADLALSMARYWTSFAATGAPQVRGASLETCCCKQSAYSRVDAPPPCCAVVLRMGKPRGRFICLRWLPMC